MKKSCNFILALLLLMIIISFSGCDRKAPLNTPTNETQETQASPSTEETSTIESSTPFAVQQDIVKNVFGDKEKINPNKTTILGPAKIQEVAITEELQLSIDFLKKGYKDIASILADDPELLSTKVEEYGQTYYSLSETLKLTVYDDVTINLETPDFQVLLSDVKTLDDLNLMHFAEVIVVLNDQGQIRRAYKVNHSYQEIHYGDFLGEDAFELAFVYNGALDTHFFSIEGDVLEPIVLNDLYHEIDTQTQGILDYRNFDVALRSNPNSVVTSLDETHTSVLPEKLFLNIEAATQSDSPIFKSISAVIDKDTMRAILSCRWQWTNGLQGDITLAEVKYAFPNVDNDHAVQQQVDMRYSDQNLISRAFEYTELIIDHGDKTQMDATDAIEKQLLFFDLDKPFEQPAVTGQLEMSDHHFERSGLSLDVTFMDDMLVFYTLKVTESDCTLGDVFKVGMRQEELISLMGVPDLVNSRSLDDPVEWSYYVKNDTGEKLLNYYYGYMKVIFRFDREKVTEMSVEIFSSPF